MLEVCFGKTECTLIGNGLNQTENITYSYEGLEIGKIGKENFDLSRDKWILKNNPYCSKSEQKQFRKEEKERFQKIISAAKKQENIRIWVASSPCSKCGYYHLIHSLQGIGCTVYTVEIGNQLECAHRKEVRDRSFGEMKASDIKDLLCLTREISQKERDDIADQWEKMIGENTSLRLNINGKLTSVSENYLDNDILSYAPNGIYCMFEHIENCLLGCPHGLSDVFYATRIESLIDSQKIAVLQRASDHEDYYKNTIMKKMI